MANNKVIYGNEVIMDITDTTAEAADVAEGAVFYDKAGVRTVGIGSGGGVFVAVAGTTTYDELKSAIDSRKKIVLINDYNGVDGGSTGRCIPSYVYYSANLICMELVAEVKLHFIEVNKQNQWSFSEAPIMTSYEPATDEYYGAIKTNPSESITLNADGQLVVGGRLGQFPNGGVYYPTNIAPTGVGSSSFLMTDGAKEISIAQRTFAIMAGANITCKSAAAGSTTYRVSNTQTNRFALAAVVGGRAALSQADAAENGTAAISSITFANGGNLTVPYFGANENSNDIIVTLARSINPNAATTQIRVYGKNNSTDNILVGQGVGANGGKAISLGQSTYAGGNQNIAFGNATYVNANNSVGMGHTMLVNKQYCLGAGQGHDFTNGSNGTTAVGTWSTISSKSKFVVGNGTAYDQRSNIFEVQDNSGATEMIVKSPNGTRFKIKVSDTGEITATAV